MEATSLEEDLLFLRILSSVGEVCLSVGVVACLSVGIV